MPTSKTKKHQAKSRDQLPDWIIRSILFAVIGLAIYFITRKLKPELFGLEGWLEGFQAGKTGKTGKPGKPGKNDKSAIKFRLAGYVPFLDLVISRALHNKLRKTIESTYTMSPIASDQAAQLKNKSVMEADLAKVPKPEDIPRLYTYITVDEPGRLHIMVSGIKKSDALAKVLNGDKDANRVIEAKPRDSAIREFDSVYSETEFSTSAANPEVVARFTDLLTRYPIGALDLHLSTKLKSALATYNSAASGTSVPLDFLRVNQAELTMLGLDPDSDNTYQQPMSPLANLVAGNEQPPSGSKAALRNQPIPKLTLSSMFDTWPINFIISPERKADTVTAEEAAIKSIVMSTLIDNPNSGIHIAPDRIQVYKQRIVADGIVNVYLQVGDKAGEVPFQDVLTKVAANAIPVSRDLLTMQSADSGDSAEQAENPKDSGQKTEPVNDAAVPAPVIDFALTVPIHDFQRLKIIVKKLEKDV
jgi:hypothetical protein